MADSFRSSLCEGSSIIAAASSFRQKGTLQSTEKEVKKKVVAAKGGVACFCTRSRVVYKEKAG